MTRFRRAGSLFAAVCLFTLFGATACKKGAGGEDTTEPVVEQKSAIRFGVLPSVRGEQREIYGPFVRELGKALGREVELYVAEDYESLQGALLRGELEMAQVSAYLLASTAIAIDETDRRMHALAQEIRPESEKRVGVLVVAPDSKLETLADLKGKTVAYVDDSSSSGYHYPRIKLRAAGFDPDTFFADEVLAGSHDAVIAKLKAGEVEVGATSEQAAALSGLRIVERTAPIPEDAIVTLDDAMSAEDRAQVTRFLMEAHKNRELTNFFIARRIASYGTVVIEVYDPQKQEIAESAAPAEGDAATAEEAGAAEQ